MRLLVRYLDGCLQAAIPIAMFDGRLRVAIPGCDDAVGFRWANGQWLAEDGGPVEIQFDTAPEEFYWCVQQAAKARQMAHDSRTLEPWATYGLHAPFVARVN